jgi:hypothetical protein
MVLRPCIFLSAMEAERQTTSQKHHAPNQRVSSAVGDFIPGPSKCRCPQWLFGHVIRAKGEKCYLVCFDDGQEKECSSNILKVESLSASLPPDMLLPVREVTWDVSAVEESAGDPDKLDNEEAEDMPAIRPEEEDAEAAEEEPNALETDANVEVNVAPTAVNNLVGGIEGNKEAVQNNSEVSGDVHDPNGRMPGQI